MFGQISYEAKIIFLGLINFNPLKIDQGKSNGRYTLQSILSLLTLLYPDGEKNDTIIPILLSLFFILEIIDSIC